MWICALALNDTRTSRRALCSAHSRVPRERIIDDVKVQRTAVGLLDEWIDAVSMKLQEKEYKHYHFSLQKYNVVFVFTLSIELRIYLCYLVFAGKRSDILTRLKS